MMKQPTIKTDAKALEDAFFAQQNAMLLRRLREQAAKVEKKHALASALGVEDAELLDRLMELDLCPETVVAVNLVPLVEVAWADGAIQSREREAILKGAAEQGIDPGSVPFKLLENWLSSKPDADLLAAWQRYAGSLMASIPQGAGDALKRSVLQRARAVAEAAGGFLGFGDKVSRQEEAVLEVLERTFS